MQLLRTILIILFVYYLFKILSRLFAPTLIRYASKKMEKKFGSAFQQQQRQTKHTNKDGETSIDKKPKSNSESSKNVGEYIDFEEID